VRAENDKASGELSAFARFIRLSGLPIPDRSVQKRNPPEPDILCQVGSELVAFELAEACVPEFAQAISAISRTGSHEPVWGSDTVEQTVRNKLQKIYSAAGPIELLVYTDSRIPPSAEVLLSQIRFALAGELGPFRRVWLMSTSVLLAASVES